LGKIGQSGYEDIQITIMIHINKGDR